ncbi:Orotate phosphoribosyltransferase [Buchnera aphidicola (Eriosoma lanigerum)]|uniref:orotate phosphoribosyltransferase n=1 Tax=Buchnera aphidicola TaxID=9 RepID=UPI003463D195
MLDFQKEFIEFSLKKKALTFGKYTLKSGRISPYFFNTSVFYTGNDIIKLGYFYAHLIIYSKIKFNSLLGLAYKGIPIVVSTAIALNKQLNCNIPYAFNRKENKKYGDYGSIVGNNNSKNNILIIDDVITAGTAIRESITQIQKNHLSVASSSTNTKRISAAIVALNRNEIGYNNIASIKEIHTQYHCPVFSIITIQNLLQFMIEEKITSYVEQLTLYLKKYSSSI